MVQLETILFNRYPNEAHFQFLTDTLATFENTIKVRIVLGPLYSDFTNYYYEEKLCMDWVHSKLLTAQIKVAYKKVEQSLVGLKTQVRSACYNETATIADAANRIYEMILSYGAITGKPYIEEVGCGYEILGHIETDYSKDATDISVAFWAGPISYALLDLSTLLKKRNALDIKKPQPGLREVRRKINKLWTQMAVIINSNAVVETATDFKDFINVLNPEIVRLNATYRRIRHDISKSEPQPIPIQLYTGLPCTPITDVLYITTKNEILKLELGKDYNVTYKNNIGPGSGYFTAHGKGAYKGKKMISFEISRRQGIEFTEELGEKEAKGIERKQEKKEVGEGPKVNKVLEVDLVSDLIEEKGGKKE